MSDLSHVYRIWFFAFNLGIDLDVHLCVITAMSSMMTRSPSSRWSRLQSFIEKLEFLVISYISPTYPTLNSKK